MLRYAGSFTERIKMYTLLLFAFWMLLHGIGLVGMAAILTPFGRYQDRLAIFAVGVASTMIGLCWGAHFFPGN